MGSKVLPKNDLSRNVNQANCLIETALPDGLKDPGHKGEELRCAKKAKGEDSFAFLLIVMGDFQE